MTALTEDQIASLLARTPSIGVRHSGVGETALFICSAEEWAYLLSHRTRADGLEEKVRELEAALRPFAAAARAADYWVEDVIDPWHIPRVGTRSFDDFAPRWCLALPDLRMAARALVPEVTNG